MNSIPDIMTDCKSSLTDWSVVITVVMTMRQIVLSIVKNQASGGKKLVSEAIADTVRV